LSRKIRSNGTPAPRAMPCISSIRAGAARWLYATCGAQRDHSDSSMTLTAVHFTSQLRKTSTYSRMRARCASPWAAPIWPGVPARSRTGMVGWVLLMERLLPAAVKQRFLFSGWQQW
jgi:hypothetical protein